MAKGQKSGKGSLERLTRLPRRPEQVIEGGKRVIPLYFYENKQTFQPQIAIWLDPANGRMLASDVINPLESHDGGISQALDVLEQAMVEPAPMPEPPKGGLVLPSSARRTMAAGGLPGTVRVNDQALAEAVRERLAPLEVNVEYIAESPMFEEAFQSLSQALGADGSAEPPQPFAWEIDSRLLQPLYGAASGFWKRAPWEYMPDEPPVQVHLGDQGPEPGVETIYASIMGGAGEVMGVAVYYSLEALQRMVERGQEMLPDEAEVEEAIEMMRQSGAPVNDVPPDELRAFVGQMLAAQQTPTKEQMEELVEDGLVCFFDPADERDPTYLEWLDAHKVKYGKFGVPYFMRLVKGGDSQPPNARETRALTLMFEGLNQFFSQHQRALKQQLLPVDGLKHAITLGSGPSRATIEVSFPPPGYELEYEEEEDLEDEEEEDEEDEEEDLEFEEEEEEEDEKDEEEEKKD